MKQQSVSTTDKSGCASKDNRVTVRMCGPVASIVACELKRKHGNTTDIVQRSIIEAHRSKYPKFAQRYDELIAAEAVLKGDGK